jgi:hypothetical protein
MVRTWLSAGGHLRIEERAGEGAITRVAGPTGEIITINTVELIFALSHGTIYEQSTG